MKLLTIEQVKIFQKKIYDFYQNNKRSFVWREQITPYNVVVSEIMLQQTQTARVVHKFNQWLQRFPTFKSLASASTCQVLACWQGLGYNRRALALHEFAQRIMNECDGIVPNDVKFLETYKGIGSNTAASICAFAFNEPVVFIETNIRTVFIHEFFKDQKNIHDSQLLSRIKETVDMVNARTWYYALMDYGVFLKTKLKISNKASKHYVTQSKFIGSKRQLRGSIVKIMSNVGSISFDELFELIACDIPNNQHCIDTVLNDLQNDGFLIIEKDHIIMR